MVFQSIPELGGIQSLIGRRTGAGGRGAIGHNVTLGHQPAIDLNAIDRGLLRSKVHSLLQAQDFGDILEHVFRALGFVTWSLYDG